MSIEDIDPDDVLNFGSAYLIAEAATNLTARDLEGDGGYSKELRHTVADLLRQALHTQRSINMLIGAQDGGDFLLGADALSLAREQAEKVFTAWLLMDRGEDYLTIYNRDSDVKLYQRHLLRQREFGELERWSDVMADQESRINAYLIDMNGWTQGELDTLKRNLFYEGQRPPSLLKDIKNAKFPTPAQIVERAFGSDAHEYLFRWYREYAYLSGFTHGGFQKQMLTAVRDVRLGFADEMKEEYYRKTVPEGAFISLIAIGSLCAEVTYRVNTRLDTMGRVTDLWNELTRSALIAKIFWKMRVKGLLGAIG